MTITNGTCPSTAPSGTIAPVKTSAIASVTPTSITLDANSVSSMLEVRAAIDALDVQIVTLLGTRLRFIEAASRIKPVKEAVRDEPRKRDVLDKAMATAEKVNFPPKLMEDIYEVLVEGCINYEGVKFDERTAKKAAGDQ